MVIALDASTPAAVTGTTAALTTVSFTPPSGALVALLYGANNPGTADVSIATVTNTGTAITWQRRARKNRATLSDGGQGQEGGAEIWTGVGNGGAITVTTNGVGTGAGAEKLLRVQVLTGVDLTQLANIVAAANNAGTPSGTLLACLLGSYGLAVSSDWSQAGLGTVGTGQTMMSESNVAGQISLHTWRTTTALAAAGSQTMNLTAPVTQDYNLVAIELRDASAAPALPPIIVLPPRR